MKVAILAGGLGTRLSEETTLKPKPMVEVGTQPILWHIMKHYSHYGFNDFVILGGYKSYLIKEYFVNYSLHRSDITVRTGQSNSVKFHNSANEDWNVTIVDTGADTMTGGRILRAKDYIGNEAFMLTYGDGLSDIKIPELLDSHKRSKALVTLTAVQPEGRFGILEIDQAGRVDRFIEKPKGDGSWINAGFFVCEPQVFNYIREGDATIFERGPLEAITQEKKLNAYKHSGFWKCMDTLRDKTELNEIWESKQAYWKVD